MENGAFLSAKDFNQTVEAGGVLVLSPSLCFERPLDLTIVII